ncbi:HNH endonuclease [Streptomyces sp. NPDC088252]|uniref:HNH endonuclease n=1 Tax=unclassified Streptomyces TaxID=2593676 RepID=UPI00381F4275
MATLKIDSRTFSHPKVTMAGNAAVGLWVRLASWAVRYHPGDWRVPQDVVRSYSTPAQVRRLVAAGLAQPVSTGYELDAELLGWCRSEPRAIIPAEQRRRIYERDGNACLRCGTSVDLTLDHIYPWSLGGADTDENLRTLCRPCNSSKGAKV